MTAFEPLQAGPYPEPTDPPDGPNQLAALAVWAAGRLVMRFATTTTRDAAITSPVEGMRCVTGSGATLTDWQYRSGAWRNVSAPLAWTAYTPSWTNVTVGNGTVAARYRQWGDQEIEAEIAFTLGSISAFSASTAYFTLPVAPAAEVATLDPIGRLYMRNGTAIYDGSVSRTGSSGRCHTYNGAQVTSSSPFAWATGHVFFAKLRYPI